ncbi:copper resistance D family protein (plasmid) [Blastomonas sp. RAC04]|uniref:copper homeostasis membrane protein CopD n=1 Tax=Blastomonas sp. RAC04 TaxID=1842535 RepID=UPI00083D3D42|nr:copper homeostasis membrane protein CopD [Blastomonas sp. RAC04]AOF98693.1 copper resistance D family protein [Blastomonas sp. RAC04]
MNVDWLHPALRFAQYVVLLGLFGMVAIRVVRLRQVVPETSMTSFRAIAVAAMAAPVLSLAVMLVGVAAMMGQPIQDLELATVQAMVLMTDTGRAFLARMVLLTLGLAAMLFIRPITPRHILAAIFYGLALSTLAWSGHAAATDGAFGLVHRLNDGLHLMAAGLWIGAISWFTILVLAAHKNPDQIKLADLRDAMESFAPLGITLVIVVAVTGVLNSQLVFGLENSMDVLGTTYGWLLAAKVLAVALMVMCAARNARLVRRRFIVQSGSRADTDVALVALRSSLAFELLLAIFVVMLVAFTGLASPVG